MVEQHDNQATILASEDEWINDSSLWIAVNQPITKTSFRHSVCKSKTLDNLIDTSNTSTNLGLIVLNDTGDVQFAVDVDKLVVVDPNSGGDVSRLNLNKNIETGEYDYNFTSKTSMVTEDTQSMNSSLHYDLIGITKSDNQSSSYLGLFLENGTMAYDGITRNVNYDVSVNGDITSSRTFTDINKTVTEAIVKLNETDILINMHEHDIQPNHNGTNNTNLPTNYMTQRNLNDTNYTAEQSRNKMPGTPAINNFLTHTNTENDLKIINIDKHWLIASKMKFCSVLHKYMNVSEEEPMIEFIKLHDDEDVTFENFANGIGNLIDAGMELNNLTVHIPQYTVPPTDPSVETEKVNGIVKDLPIIISVPIAVLIAITICIICCKKSEKGKFYHDQSPTSSDIPVTDVPNTDVTNFRTNYQFPRYSWGYQTVYIDDSYCNMK